MRPLRLEIEGLTSFRTRQEIDFSDLDLFVITGPTGSGKSSILDAIALALYGEVPRTGKHGVGELVTHGAALARVLLEFQSDGVAYRVARRLPRSGAQSAELERRDGEDWLSEVNERGVRAVNERIAELVGLDFDAFTRTVVLPQGDFDAFLSGDPPERRRILIRLLDLGRYQRAAQIAGQRATQFAAEASMKEDLLATQYAGVDAAALADARKLEAEAQRRDEAAAGAQARVGELAAARTRIAEGQRTATKLHDELRRTGERVAALRETFAAIEPEVTAARVKVETAEQALAMAAKAAETASAEVDATLRRTGDEASLARLEAALQTIAQEQRRLSQLDGQIDAAASVAAEHEAASTAAANASAVAEAEEIAAGEADAIAQTALAEARQRRDAARKRAEVEAAIVRSEEALGDARRADEQAKAAVAEGAAMETAARDHLDHLRVENEAAVFRMRLVVGDDCPVCRGRVTAIPATAADLAATITAANAALRDAVAQSRARANAASAAEATARLAAERIAALREELAALPAGSSVGEAEEAHRRAEEAANAGTQRRAAATAARRMAGEAQIKAHREHSSALAVQENFLAQADAARSRIAAAAEQLADAFPDGIPVDAAAVVDGRRRELAAARGRQDAARRDADTARRALDEARRHDGEIAARLRAIDAEAMQERGGLASLLTSARELAAAVPLLPPNTSAIADRLDDLADAAAEGGAATARLLSGQADALRDAERTLQAELAQHGLAPESLDESVVRNAAAALAREAALALERARQHVGRLETDLLRKAEMEADAAARRQAATLHQTLAQALQANNFIDFVLGESVRRLAAIASAELRSISGGRYSLKARDIGFIVVDHANADEERSVSTLSGGETFLASLSLAMALAQSVTDIAGAALGARLEAMFIDEGFGTLDPEALEMVVDALERLRDSERMVGVITHVAALAERIPDGLAVERFGNASRVSVRG